jgi:hypothetical protein
VVQSVKTGGVGSVRRQLLQAVAFMLVALPQYGQGGNFRDKNQPTIPPITPPIARHSDTISFCIGDSFLWMVRFVKQVENDEDHDQHRDLIPALLFAPARRVIVIRIVVPDSSAVAQLWHENHPFFAKMEDAGGAGILLQLGGGVRGNFSTGDFHA